MKTITKIWKIKEKNGSYIVTNGEEELRRSNIRAAYAALVRRVFVQASTVNMRALSDGVDTLSEKP